MIFPYAPPVTCAAPVLPYSNRQSTSSPPKPGACRKTQMAFPFEPTQLRAQLRAFAVSTADDGGTAARVVKPLVLGLFHHEYNQAYLQHIRPASPPIPTELPPGAAYSSDPLQLGHRKRYTRKPPPRSDLQSPQKETAAKGKTSAPDTRNVRRKSAAGSVATLASTIDEEVSDSLVTTIALEPAAKKKKRVDSKQKDKLKNPLTKLFQKSDKTHPETTDSDSSSGHITLESDHEHLGATTESGSNAYSSTIGVDGTRRDQDLVDGEQEIVAEMESGRAPTTRATELSLITSFGSESIDDVTVDDDVIENELSDSSTDSAFTDIEADPMMDSGSIYEYTVPESYMLEGANSKYTGKQKRRKNKPGSESLLGKSGKALAPDSLFTSSTTNKGTSRFDKLPLLPRRSSFSFEKMYNAVQTTLEGKKSNLSKLIDSRYQSSNPLNYYSFVTSDIADGAKQAKVDIFVPPNMKPVLKDMKFLANVAIIDCIGSILLALSKLPDYKDKLDAAFMNPNNWRLELIDEDGELYDSTFGVLDRTRLLASYNCPNLLALCRVTNPVEVASNNKQLPLPLEFKQNLDYYQRKLESSKLNANSDLSPSGPQNLHEDSIEVKVCRLPDTSEKTFISFFVSSKMTVEQLIDHISRLYHIDPSRYRLAELAPNKKQKSTMLIDETEKEKWRPPANNSDVLGDLESQKFQLIPNPSQHVRSMVDGKVNGLSYVEAGITPLSSSTFIPLGITPTVTTLEGKFQEMAVDAPAKPQVSELKPEAVRKASNSGRRASSKDPINLGDIIHGKGPQLPATLNTIYFKWKVFRKKSPILNRIEKALIIDGDYIHLAPTDDTNWRKNPYENPFSQSNTNNTSGNAASHHHHHYLHHYNYSKYYNDSMMKTSSFHITQIIKLKQYKQSKNPNHFKIVIKKENEPGAKESVVRKKYDLEAENVAQCEEIIEKIKWALQVYNASNMS